ncbi:MAG: bifunctional tRNA (5-methylaminomethyl-2-thiouridine)(34)-methyltransferase MnmD/FAD-dependent 5-carboxymethylaminomethyl-2-thiouridine(34) oxidoreductase MnmC [Oleispira sp.]|nr:bifunctional tRNA (5-methylaminomethyl-2-thiouridine)(34)-methyltransferase MnmD/FAD-dependent 5-carboxymethylaminomethyl-2-thiouridine(34) oxidoreductase MnmC [Oleispira sp.]
MKNPSFIETTQNSSKKDTSQKQLRPAKIHWDQQGQPFSEDFNDIYFSADSAIEERRRIFINPGRLQERWQQHEGSFTLVETGFGTGLNFILTWLEWIAFQDSQKDNTQNQAIKNQAGSEQEVSNHLHFISIEKYPLDKDQIAQALALFPQLKHLSVQLTEQYPLLIKGFHSLQFKDQNLSLTLIFDDISSALSQLNGSVDAWYLDGFPPAKNPDMWTDALYVSMAQLSKENTRIATHTADGDVRCALSAAGFELNKVNDGMECEMLHGKFIQSQGPLASTFDTLKPWLQPKPTVIKKIAIIGAGIAGCTTAYALARRGIAVTVIDQHGIATEASGNPQGAMYAKLAAGEATHSEIYVQGYLQSLRWLHQHLETGDGWDNCGLIQLASTEKEALRQKKFIANTNYPKELLHSISAEQASKISGMTMNNGGLFFPEAGWVSPQRLCQQLVKHPLITVEKNHIEDLAEFKKDNGYSHVIIACANQSQKLLKDCYLPTKSIRGQLTYLEQTNGKPQPPIGLKTVLCGKGYIAPAHQGKFCLGASYNIKDDETQMRLSDHQKNFNYLEDFGQEFQQLHQELKEQAAEKFPGRTGFRCTTPDYLPMAGPLINEQAFDQEFTAIRKNLARYPRRAVKFHQGLYLNIGHGSRGLTSAPLCAELIASYICGENFPLAKSHAESLLPARFFIREMVRNKR